MEELFKERLERLDSLEERRVLKKIINSVFSELVQHTEKELQALEKRLFHEIDDIESNFDIYGAITTYENYDSLDETFFPMVQEDTEGNINLTEIEKRIREDDPPVLSRIYVPMDWMEFRQLIEKLYSRRFKGTLKTTKAAYPIEVQLRRHTQYMEQIEKLYETFILNDIPWRTVFHPYLTKFLDIILRTSIRLETKETIEEITFDLEELNEYQKEACFPLWNIDVSHIRNVGFASPMMDGVNYEYEFIPEGYGEGDGYLIGADKVPVSYVRRGKENIIVVSDKKSTLKWPLLRFKQEKKTERVKTLSGNQRKEHFIDKYARKQQITVRSICEVSRIINTFVAAEGITLEKVEVKEPGMEKEETYPLNAFIRDNVRNIEEKKVMQISFGCQKKDILTRDKMSFLVSEIQLQFPEYKCVGDLL